MGKTGTEGEHSMSMTLYFAICNFSCPDIFFLALPKMPPKGVITAFIVRAIITMFFGQIVLQTSIRLASLRVRQIKCPSWKDIVRLSSFLRESTSHATSLFTMIAAHSTLAASTQLSDLSFFDTDSSFWVCDNSATGHISKDKSSTFEVGSATGISTPTLMDTVILRLIDDEEITHSFEFTNVSYLPDSPVNLLSLRQLAELYPDATGHPDRNGTGIQSGFDNHVLFWNREQFKKTFRTASSGLPECLFNSGYSRSRLEAFSTILSSFYNDKICWALASKEKINELANLDDNDGDNILTISVCFLSISQQFFGLLL